MKLLLAFIIFNFYFLISFAQYTKLLDFSGISNGIGPQGSLISDGTFLYGMALEGGTGTCTSGCGVLFKIKPDGTGDTVLFNFTGTNGIEPYGSLISDSAFLYGMTTYGGTSANCQGGCGVIFKIKPDGIGDTVLLNFTGANGSGPYGSLISDGTFLYGMTHEGGTNNMGVIFKIKSDGTGYTKLLDFAGSSNGEYPLGSLISDGTYLYGMTSGGGMNGEGVVFKIKPDGTNYTKLLDFAGSSNGGGPYGSLISDGTFIYGMTWGGGTSTNCGGNGCGTIFKIKPDGTGYVKLHDFAGGLDGIHPQGSLISNGIYLYGMTSQDGTNNCWGNGCGILFKIKSDGTGYNDLLDFNLTNGYRPVGSLIYDGTFFYGMTSGGGNPSNMGTIFKFQDTTTTGIAENNLQNDFTIFPNPTTGAFIIQFSEKISAIQIVNLLGEKIYSSHASTLPSMTNQQIDLSSQPNGIYFLQMNTEKGIARKKIVISH